MDGASNGIAHGKLQVKGCRTAAHHGRLQGAAGDGTGLACAKLLV